jgi:Cof subfamily protein (haloacid dehalogenase superfamily)
MYAAIATDLDGTLLDADHSITPYTVATLQEAARRGIHMVIATGRHWRDVQLLTAELDFPLSIISSNGARVHSHEGELLYAADLDPAVARALIQPELARGTLLCLYLDEGGLSRMHEGYVHPEDEHEFGTPCADLASHSGQGVAKVLYRGTPERLAEIEQHIVERFGAQVTLTYSQPQYLEAMAPGVSKGHALTALLARLGVDAAHCAAFGDGMNDVEMLQTVGHPFRMANANPKLHVLLPHTGQAGHHDESGVARQIRQALGMA